MQKVIWKEGMLLRPQHFQQSDRYYQNQLQVRTQQQHRFNWGFHSLSFDNHHLSVGKIVISQASGILPDGSLFDIQHQTTPIVWESDAPKTNLNLYLAISLSTINSPEARDEKETEINTRYVSHDLTISDNNAQVQNLQTICCGELDFHIITEEEIDNHWVKIKLCEIKQVTPEGAIQLNPNFEASFINGVHSSLVHRSLREVLTLVTHKADILAERITKSGHATSEIGDFLLLQLLNKYEPQLHYLNKCSQYHPEELFLLLSSLQGELSTYDSGHRRPDLKLSYNHKEQGESFDQILFHLRKQLNQSLKQNAFEIPLQKRNHGVLIAPISDDSLLQEATFILAARSHTDAESLRKQLPPQLKVGPVEKIRNLVNLQLPGITCRSLSVAPRQVPFHGDYCYFTLDLTSNDRSQLTQSGGFAFHIAGDFPELSLFFWAIRNS